MCSRNNMAPLIFCATKNINRDSNQQNDVLSYSVRLQQFPVSLHHLSPSTKKHKLFLKHIYKTKLITFFGLVFLNSFSSSCFVQYPVLNNRLLFGSSPFARILMLFSYNCQSYIIVIGREVKSTRQWWQ